MYTYIYVGKLERKRFIHWEEETKKSEGRRGRGREKNKQEAD